MVGIDGHGRRHAYAGGVSGDALCEAA
jgi:hypothetical protein